MKPVQPDEKWALVMGENPLPSNELANKLWACICTHELQVATRRTLIKADPNLRAGSNGRQQVGMLEMTKLVSGHMNE
jgi:chromatin remodeling complex protein RSC6